jgi:hypothetical protein
MKLKISTYLFVFTLLCAVVLSLSSCKKKDTDPVIPSISFVSISDNTVEQFNNSIRVTFDYEDWQGDLGETDPDNYSLRVKDSRLTGFDWYHIPPMTPDLQELHIKGTYLLELNPLFLMGNGTQESTTLTIQIRDRAGNWSNEITTPLIAVVDSL